MSKLTPTLTAILFVLSGITNAAGNLHCTAQSDRGGESKDGLELRIQMDRETYSLRDYPVLKISLKNIGQEPLSLYKEMGWGARSSLLLAVRESSGRWLHSSFISEVRDHPPFPEEDFTTPSAWRKVHSHGSSRVGK